MTRSNDKEMVEMNNKFGDIVISLRHYSIITYNITVDKILFPFKEFVFEVSLLNTLVFLHDLDILGLSVFNLGNLHPGEILTSLRAHPRTQTGASFSL